MILYNAYANAYDPTMAMRLSRAHVMRTECYDVAPVRSFACHVHLVTGHHVRLVNPPCLFSFVSWHPAPASTYHSTCWACCWGSVDLAADDIMFESYCSY